MAEIVIKNLRKEFGAFVAVQESSFTIEDGEFFMLLGPSGCGKKNSPSSMVKLDSLTATKSPNSLRTFLITISAMVR